jgi:phosphotriesterase-related protein
MALEQIDLLTSAGVDPAHIIIGHLDRKLEWEYHREVARRGVFMGFDQIGKQQYAPDSRRVEFIARLAEAGYGGQILLAGDQAHRSYWPAYGFPDAPGLAYIFEKFHPMLRQAGFSPDEIRSFSVSNPAQAFSFADGRG